MPVNYVLLAVLSGIIGLVMSGFTSWHLWLTSRGRTTIESLEKTRYLSPIRNSMSDRMNDRAYIEARDSGRLSISDQLREIHANALPGITRPEEGEEDSGASRSPSLPHYNSSSSSDYTSSYSSYEQRHRQQAFDRYDSYLDERDNEQLPNAFDLGWRRNFQHVFGPSLPLSFIPICNTIGDGWTWEPSPKWLEAHERIRKQRETEARIQKQRERAAGWGPESPTEAEFSRSYAMGRSVDPPSRMVPRVPEWQQGPGGRGVGIGGTWKKGENRYLMTSRGVMMTPVEGRRSPGKADQVLGRERGMYADGDVQMQPLDRRRLDQYYVSDEEEEEDEDDGEVVDGGEGGSANANGVERKAENRTPVANTKPMPKATENWNDIPDDFLKGPVKKAESKKKAKDGGWDDWEAGN